MKSGGNIKRDPKAGVLVAATTLTGTYAVQGNVISAHAYDQITLFCSWVKGDETSCEIKLEFSDTAAFTNAYDQIVVNTDAAGESTILSRNYTVDTASKKFILNIASQGFYFRVKAKATGGTPTGTLAINYRCDTVQKGG